MHTHWKWLSAKNENTVNLKSASFVVITLFTKVRRFDSYTFIQKSPGLHFGERFTLSWKSSKCRSRDSQRLEMVPGSSNRKAWLQGNRSMMFGSCYVTHNTPTDWFTVLGTTVVYTITSGWGNSLHWRGSGEAKTHPARPPSGLHWRLAPWTSSDNLPSLSSQ